MNNEPAFPRPAVFTAVLGLASPEQDGMSLRDYFAAKAMQGVLANYQFDMNSAQDDVAVAAYELADAMMKARGES